MKRQLERLKGKRLVTGDANLMTKNEICINTTSDGGVEVKEIGVDGKIKDLANSGGSSSTTYNRYYRFIKPVDSTIEEALEILLVYTSPFLKVESDTQYNYIVGCAFSEQLIPEIPLKFKAFQFTPVIAGYISGEYRLAKDIEDFIYLYKLVNVTDLSPILDYIEEITADEFFNLNQL